MKLISFKSISLKNFLSFGEQPFILNFTPGINIIIGINKDKNQANGVGKTSILQGIFFAIFGDTINELKKEDIVNFKNKKNCEVILEFEITTNTIERYKIVRNLGPSKCQLFKNEIDITKSSILRTNEYIQQLLNTNPTVFKHAVIMTINNTLPFMSLKKIEKRKFIEGILQLEIFGQMLQQNNLALNESKKEKDIEMVKYEGLIKTLQVYIKQSDNFDNDIKNEIEQNESIIKNNIKSIEDIQLNIKQIDINQKSTLETNIKDLNIKKLETNKKIREYDKILIESQNIINNNKNKIDALSQNKCVTCNREYNDDDKSERQQKINETTLVIEQCQNTIKNTQEKIEKCYQIIDIINKKNTEIQKELINIDNILNNNNLLKTQIHGIQNQNKILNEKNESLRIKKNNFNELIIDLKKDIDNCEQKINLIKTSLSIYESSKFILSDEGVKSNIIKKLLGYLNNNLNKYLNEIEAPCNCVFDEYFEETFIDKMRQKCSYDNFSAGEKKRIDISVLFTFIELRKIIGNNIINFIMFDELFDSSLDNEGVNKVLNILIERVNKYNECIYIVTHRSNLKNISNSNVIELEKRNGYTYLKEK
jgi:DNA repair exonuclease SbcCD ATPase subunit